MKVTIAWQRYQGKWTWIVSCLTYSRNDLDYYRSLQSLICNRLRNFQIIVLRNQLQRIVIYELQIIEPWLATTIG